MRALLKGAVLVALLSLLAWLVAQRVAEQRASVDRPGVDRPAAEPADARAIAPDDPVPALVPSLLAVRVTSGSRPAAGVPVAFLDWRTRIAVARGRTAADGSFTAEVPAEADLVVAAGGGADRTVADPGSGAIELGREAAGVPDAPAGFLGDLLDLTAAGPNVALPAQCGPKGAPTGTVTGTVWLSDRSAEGAYVILVAGANEARVPVRVGPDGGFGFEDRPGARRLYLVPRDDPGAVQMQPIVVRALVPTTADFGRSGGRTIRGRVSARGRGLAGVTVEFGGSQDEGRTVFTDRQGRYRLEAVGPGHLRARATVSGVRHVRRLRVRGPDLTANWVLPDTRWTGVLRDRAGNPVARGEVALAREGGWPAPTAEREYEGKAAALTDGQGRFRFEALPEGTYRWTAGGAEGTVTLREGEPVTVDLRVP